MSDYLIERTRRNPAITLHFQTEVTALHGDVVLKGVTIARRGGAAPELIPAAGLFVMVGAAPNTGWLADLAALDAKGFVVTADGFDTSRPGTFAVDVPAESYSSKVQNSSSRRCCGSGASIGAQSSQADQETVANVCEFSVERPRDLKRGHSNGGGPSRAQGPLRSGFLKA